MAACVSNPRCRTLTALLSSSFNFNKYAMKYTSLCRFVKLCNLCSSQVCHSSQDDLWLKIRDESQLDTEQEPTLFDCYYSSVLSHDSLESALASTLAVKLSNSMISKATLLEIFCSAFAEDDIKKAIREDLRAVRERDPACISYVHCFLHFKGFLSCQAHRAAHKLWTQGRTSLALQIQNRVSETFALDIHPGAKLGRGVVLDHGTGIVIGETAIIGDNVTILHNVTLGSTGKEAGERHPKIGNRVFIGAGSEVLGNIRIGEGAKVGAGSVVVKDLPPNSSSVGNPARLVQSKRVTVYETKAA